LRAIAAMFVQKFFDLGNVRLAQGLEVLAQCSFSYPNAGKLDREDSIASKNDENEDTSTFWWSARSLFRRPKKKVVSNLQDHFCLAAKSCSRVYFK
jgi:hypothetical protein